MTPGTNEEKFSCNIIEWEDAVSMSRTLAYNIRNSGYSPDIIIAIGRGGYVPARIVCDFMLHEMLTSIKIEHWGIAGKKKEATTVVFPLSIDVSGKKILVIDDVTDTGDTLEAAVEYLETFGPEEIRTGVLQHKECSSFIPDFYAEYVGEWRWIVYPWARHEEVFGFSEKVLTGDPAPVEEIESLLYERYGFAAGRRELEDALADLVSAGKAVGSKSGFRRS